MSGIEYAQLFFRIFIFYFKSILYSLSYLQLFWCTFFSHIQSEDMQRQLSEERKPGLLLRLFLSISDRVVEGTVISLCQQKKSDCEIR